MSTVERRVLENGLTVVCEQRGLGPVVFTGVVYGVGSRHERPGITGISHLLEHMMFKGTKKYGKGDVARIVEKNGGDLNAFTSEDVTMYYEVFAEDRWTLALDIEAERMAHLAVDSAELESERQVILEERAMYLDIPSVELSEELMAATFRESPYRWPIIGWESDIRAITRDEVMEHYRRHYSPESAAVIVVGSVEPETAFREVEKRYGTIAPAGLPEARVPKEPPMARATRISLTRPVAVPQLQILFRAPEIGTRDAEALVLVAGVLSGTRTSRLDMALLETQRAGDIHVLYHPRADPSSFLIAVEGREEVPLREVEEIVQAEIAKVRADGVTAEEVQRAFLQIEAHHAFSVQSPSSRGFSLGWHEAHGDVSYADGVVERLRALGPEELLAAAREWLDPAASGTATLSSAPGNGA